MLQTETKNLVQLRELRRAKAVSVCCSRLSFELSPVSETKLSEPNLSLTLETNKNVLHCTVRRAAVATNAQAAVWAQSVCTQAPTG